MAKNKLDVIVKYFYPVAAGIEVNIMETYTVLAKKGWDITIHTTDYDYTKKERLPRYDEIRGLKVVRYPLKWPCFIPKPDYKNANLICIHNFDILPHFLILLKVFWQKITGQKKYALVITPHGGFNPEWRVFSKAEALVKRIYSYTLGTLFINLAANAVRAVSDWEKAEMINKGINKKLISVIVNGVEHEAFADLEKHTGNEVKEKVKSWGKYLLQIGRIYPIKNYETVIKALKEIPQDINYVIVGPEADQEYKNYLIKLAKELGVEKRLIFAGIFRGLDKFYIIKHAKIMVHMAIWESFCNVVHEALSQGTPVVAADNTALTYLIKNNENGFLAETKNYKQVAEKINFILNPKNSDLIQKMSQKNSEGAKEETWENTAKKMHELYSLLVEKANEKINI